MEIQYKKLWSQSIQGNSKLRSYVKFKHEFKLENYLLHESQDNHRNLTRLRTSSHKLTVETGKYNKVALKDRLCQLCDANTVEDEYHFVMTCPLYNELRCRTNAVTRQFHLYLDLWSPGRLPNADVM